MNQRPMNQRRGVVAVVRRENRFLVIRRSRFVRAPGAFCFPGGGLEGTESEKQALLREMREELSAEIHVFGRLWQNRTANGVHLAWWQAQLQADSPLVPNPAEVESIHWMTATEMCQRSRLLATNREFLAAIRRGEVALR